MSRYLGLKKAVLALMLTCAAVVAAKAQDQGPTRPGYCTGGPFSLTAGEEVKFHVALDDVVGAPATKVTLRLYDSEGTVVARSKVITLAAGKTVTLPYQGSGLLRAQATFDSALIASDRRLTVGSVELHDVNGLRLVIPVQCTPNENIGR